MAIKNKQTSQSSDLAIARAIMDMVGGMGNQVQGVINTVKNAPTPMGVGNALAGLISGQQMEQPKQQVDQQSQQPNQQIGISQNQPMIEPKDPVSKAVLKRVIKNTESQVDEAMASGVPVENILQSQNAKSYTLSKLFGLVKDVGGGLINSGGINQTTGEVTPGSALFGLIQEHPSNVKIRQETANLSPQRILDQKVKEAETIPLSLADRQKIQLENAFEESKTATLTPENLFTKFETAVKPFIDMRDAHTRVLASSQDPSPAGDLALVYNYMKILDPGSTVMEGERANAQNAGSAFDKVGALYNQVISGRRLTQAQRADFVNRSQKLFDSAEKNNKKMVAEFSRLGKMNRVDPSTFIRDTSMADDVSQITVQKNDRYEQVNRIKSRFKDML